MKTVSALSYISKHCQGVTDWTGSLNDLVYKQLCNLRKYSVYALNISSHLEREWGLDAKERGGARLEQDPQKQRFLSVYQKVALFSYSFICNFVFSFITKLVSVSKIIPVQNVHLPHETLMYPPKIYLPTLIIVTVGPLPSHRA